MILRRKRKAIFSRERALKARPYKLPIIRSSRTDQGKLHVCVELARPRWQRWLGGGETIERTFSLDDYGQEVYDACDGRRSVQRIVKDFAGRHHVSVGEAELSVTTFLRTLMGRGMVAMEMDREPKRK